MLYIFYVLNIFKDTAESVKLNTGAFMPLIGLGYANIYILIVTCAIAKISLRRQLESYIGC